MALRHIKTKRSLKDENKHLHSLVKHLQIELENARLDISINSMYEYDVFREDV